MLDFKVKKIVSQIRFQKEKRFWPHCEKTYMLTSTAQDSHFATNGFGNGLDNNALSYFIKHVLYARQFSRRGPKSSKHTCLEKDHTLKETFTRGMMFWFKKQDM